MLHKNYNNMTLYKQVGWNITIHVGVQLSESSTACTVHWGLWKNEVWKGAGKIMPIAVNSFEYQTKTTST